MSSGIAGRAKALPTTGCALPLGYKLKPTSKL